MAFNQKEQQIIKWGLENGKSKDEVQNAILRFRTTGSPADPNKPIEQPEEEAGVIGRVGETISEAGEDVSNIIGRQDRTPLERGVQATARAFRSIPEVATDVLPQKAREGIEKAGEFIGSGIQKLADFLGGTEVAQNFVTKHPEATKDLERVLETTSAAGEIAGTAAGIQGGTSLLRQGTRLGSDLASYSSKALKNMEAPAIAQNLDISNVVGKTRNYLSRKNVGETFDSSVQRLSDEQPLNMYNNFYEQAVKFKGDAKLDAPIAQVGERIGDAFNKVIKTRQAVGKQMSDELKQISDVKAPLTEQFTKLEQELFDNGVTIKNGKVNLTRNSKVTAQDKDLIDKYVKMFNELGAEPTVGEIDAFLSRVRGEIDVFKGKNNITGTTNGERIIKQSLADVRNQLSPEVNPAFEGYFNARQDYATLSDFLDEGQRYLGKKTQSGDFARDVSLAKNSVQSILNGGKKDWLLKLEDLTGYQAIDESVLALQAMKDAGIAKGESLLDLVSGVSRVPTSARDIPSAIVEFGAKQAGERFVGDPVEQTRRVIQEIIGGE